MKTLFLFQISRFVCQFRQQHKVFLRHVNGKHIIPLTQLHKIYEMIQDRMITAAIAPKPIHTYFNQPFLLELAEDVSLMLVHLNYFSLTHLQAFPW